MNLFEPITIRGMEVPNRIVYPAIQMNMGLTNRRAKAFYRERASGGAGLVLTSNTSIDNLASEDLWGGAAQLASFVSRLGDLVDQVHVAGAKMGLQLWQANRFPQGRGVQSAGREEDPSSGDRVAPSAHEDMRELTIPVIAVGRINTPEVAGEIISTGKADMVAIGRQLIADPFWPRKVSEGRFEDVVACKSCNINCYSSAFERKLPAGAPLCKVNERVGREWEIPAPEKTGLI